MGGRSFPLAATLRAPRLLLAVLPWVAAAAAAKLALELADVHLLELNALLSGLVAANVFLLGFLLAGTMADYKESERLPGELAAALESIGDACLVAGAEGRPAGRVALEQVRDVAALTQEWLLHRASVEDVLAAIRGLNAHVPAVAEHVLAGYVTRVLGEQSTARRIVVRVDAIRSTSFVAAGYAIAEVAVVLLAGALLVTEVGAAGEATFLVAVISLVLLYLLALIRDLDDPFGYPGGAPGAADVSLQPIADVRRRLDDQLAVVGAQAGRFAHPQPLVERP